MTIIYALILLMMTPALAGAVDVNQALGLMGDPFEEKIPKPADVKVAPTAVPVPSMPTAVPVPSMPGAVAAPLPVPVPVQVVRENHPVVPQEKPNFTVEGIIWSDTIHAAVINGQMIGVGDRIANALVIDVNRNGVIVDVGGEQFTVPVQ